MESSGWDDPTTHDIDNDGLSDYIEADLQTNPENVNSPNIAVTCPYGWGTLRYEWTKSVAQIVEWEQLIYAVDTTAVVRRGATVSIYSNPSRDIEIFDFYQWSLLWGANGWDGATLQRTDTGYELTIGLDSPVGIIRISSGNWHSQDGQLVWQEHSRILLIIVFQLPAYLFGDPLECYGYREDGDAGPVPSANDRCENAAFYTNHDSTHKEQRTYILKSFSLYSPQRPEYRNPTSRLSWRLQPLMEQLTTLPLHRDWQEW